MTGLIGLQDMTYEQFADTLLWIRDKRGRIIPFVRNPIQKKIREIVKEKRKIGKKYFIILKYRRGGITTDQQAINLYSACFPGQSVVTLAHESGDTEKIFKIAQLMYSRLHPGYQPIKSRKHKRELEFPQLESEFYIGTAGARSFSRGSTLQRFHASEVAFWPTDSTTTENLIASLTEAASHGEGVLESTANGCDNWFYNKWKMVEEGQDDWHNIFLAWYEDPTNRIPLANKEEAEQIYETLTDEEKQLILSVKRRGMTLSFQQIKWRRRAKDRLRRLFLQEYPEDSETAFLISGSSYFDVNIVDDLLSSCKEPIKIKKAGILRIWEQPKPGVEYVMGSDVASGVDSKDHDFSTSVVLEKRTGRHVATLKCKRKPYEFTRLSRDLAIKYNEAFWGVERNEYGHAVLTDLMRGDLQYNNLYQEEKIDPASKQQVFQHGWPTNSRTRPIMIDELAEALEEKSLETNDRQFLAQCRNFVLKKGRMEAAEGHHDDDVMAMAIAWQMRLHSKPIPRATTAAA